MMACRYRYTDRWLCRVMPRVLFQMVKVFMPSPPYSRSKEFSRSGVLSAFYGRKLAIERQFLLPENQSLSGVGTSLFATPRTDSTAEITILRTPARSPRSLSSNHDRYPRATNSISHRIQRSPVATSPPVPSYPNSCVLRPLVSFSAN
jgi:hypothetical protein